MNIFATQFLRKFAPVNIGFLGTLIIFMGSFFLSGASFVSAAPWDFGVGQVVYTNNSFSILGQSDSVQDILLKDDGTKMYVFDSSGGRGYQYTLATPWDVSTASYDSVSYSFQISDVMNGYPRGAVFKSDGSKIYIVNSEGAFGVDMVFQYSLATPWDLSTVSYDSVSFSVAAQTTFPTSLAFSSDGTKMYTVQYSGSVYQYTLSTAWDLSTASYDSKSFNPSAQTSSMDDPNFSYDGTVMFLQGRIQNTIYQYSLSTPWDVSTATYTSKSFQYNTVPNGSVVSVQGMHFDPNGLRLYLASITLDTIYQYSLGNLDITAPTVFSLSPLNDSTGVSTTTNLVITFTESVKVGTGNISIYKTSDDTLVEAIDVTSEQVTGAGTAVITINPTDSLGSETEYYVLIGATAFTDLVEISFVGIADATAWSFTTADIIAPEISNPLPSGEQPSGTGSATLSVSTNEIATCKYSTISGTSFADMTTFSSTGATSHSTSVSTSDGVSYSYYVLCQDPSLNESSEATISFSINETPATPTNTIRTSGGASVQAQVQNLNNMGNQEAANKLIQQYSHLFAQGAPAQTSTNPSTSGPNVSSTRELQRFLNANGFPVAPSGPGSLNNETDFFGELTRQALARFQQANGISPAVGFFGPITRAFINTSTPTTPPETSSTTPNTNESSDFSRNLEFGMSGSDVTKLQELLINFGYSIPAGATGFFGQQTRDALIGYQKANSISPAVGFFGPVTRAQMN